MGELTLGSQRTHFRRSVGRRADDDRLGLRLQRSKQAFFDAALHDQARPCHARLPGGRKDSRHHSIGCGIKVGIIEDHDRRLAAQFERYMRQVFGSVVHYMTCRSRPAGKGNARHQRM